MTIHLELDPETKARLAAAAVRNGVTPEKYAGDFLRENLPTRSLGTGRLTPEDIDAMTEVMTAGSENLPVLPPEVNDRESYYEDRW